MLHVQPEGEMRGDVNVASSALPQVGKNSNLVVADMAHLPFKDEAFNVAFSNTLEHSEEPSPVLKEMARVAKRRVAVQYVARWSSARHATGHRCFLSPGYFKRASATLGYRSVQLIGKLDYPLSERLKRVLPKSKRATLPIRLLQHFERWYLPRLHRFPLEIEAWIQKQPKRLDGGTLKFVVVYNRPDIFEKCFSSSPYASAPDTVAYFNQKGEPLPEFYNDTVRRFLSEDVWFVFCHQDFILREDLKQRLQSRDTGAIYGPIGVRLNENMFLGQILQTNEVPAGVRLERDMHVQTLDAQCLIAHSSVFRQGLWFDESFRFHFYDADFCVKAYVMGFEVYAMQIDCQHKSRTITGDLDSPEYLKSLEQFREKWNRLLPIKTSTTNVA